jgi:hypothetical protein
MFFCYNIAIVEGVFMPNYVTNVIKLKSRKKSILSRMFKDIIDKENNVDFFKMLPMENWGTKWNAGYTMFTIPDLNTIYKNREKTPFIKDVNVSYLDLKLTEIQKHLKMKKGFYEIAVSFDTAWSYPEPVITKMSEMFPEVEFDIAWADEDIGYNCGSYKMKNKQESDIEQAPKYESGESDKERFYWIKKACGIKGIDPVYRGYNAAGVYSEEIEDDPEKYLKFLENIKDFK